MTYDSAGAVQERVPALGPDQRPAERRRTPRPRRPAAVKDGVGETVVIDDGDGLFV